MSAIDLLFKTQKGHVQKVTVPTGEVFYIMWEADYLKLLAEGSMELIGGAIKPARETEVKHGTG